MSDTPSRSQQISRIMDLIQDVMGKVPPSLSTPLEEAAGLILRLDDGSPVIPANEVPAEELRVRGAVPIRRMLMGPFDYIRQLFHGSETLKPGEQWTTSMATDCGFLMDIVIRMRARGECTVPNAFMKGEGNDEDAESGTKSDVAETVPPASTEFDSLLQKLGLRPLAPSKKPRRTRKKKDEQSDAG